MLGYNKARPAYYTPVFAFGKGDNYGAAFGEYLAKKFAIQPWPTASCRRLNMPASYMETDRQAEMAKVKGLGAPSVVEINWTWDTHQALMAEVAKNTPPKPSSPPAPAAKDPDDAPTAARPAAAPATSKPATPVTSAQSAPQGPLMYSYCSAYGTPAQRPASPAKQHFYITQPFQLAARERPEQAFESFLRDAHPGETISASCLSPGALEAAQASRQNTLNLRRKQSATYEIVDVGWKFAR